MSESAYLEGLDGVGGVEASNTCSIHEDGCGLGEHFVIHSQDGHLTVREATLQTQWMLEYTDTVTYWHMAV